jgi:hypothetical protein
VVDEVALERVYLPVLRFSLVSITPPILYIHLHLNTTIIRTSGRSLGNFTRIRKGEIVSVHAMKAYTRGRGIAPLILNLGDRWR